jgi:hypothetical protein
VGEYCLRITEGQVQCIPKALDISINYAVICNNCKYSLKLSDSGTC